jgi:hypothetical protein
LQSYSLPGSGFSIQPRAVVADRDVEIISIAMNGGLNRSVIFGMRNTVANGILDDGPEKEE